MKHEKKWQKKRKCGDLAFKKGVGGGFNF